ncbi:MAG: Cyclic AMP receptor-like protein [Paracidovorax wautersii]|uniref:Cyclic AMP receptor-like protein n=1 Tax=Paracidovorax wautersii TaxID=1177982 RepID=A0A7V8FR81_9BURK|nr:MAG: Cyclic AMP receptor-like protein [Paracidovorax wautersii]
MTTSLESATFTEPGRQPRPAVSLQTLRRAGVLKDLSEARLQALAQTCTWHHYEAGYTIPHPCTAGFCVVASGRVLLTSYERGGRQVAFQVMGEGDSFGAVPTLLGPECGESVEAVTLQPSLIAQLAVEDFQALLRDDPDFNLAVMREMAQAVRRLTEHIVELSTMTVRGRVLAALLRLLHRAGVQANQARIEPAPRHQVLANYVGANREQVTRELSWLQRQGVLARDGKQALVVADVARLQHLLHETRGKG